MVSITSNGSIEIVFNNSLVLGTALDQIAKVIGVRIMADMVTMEVKVMDNATFPFDKSVAKLEILPPGQLAAMNNPRAMLAGSG